MLLSQLGYLLQQITQTIANTERLHAILRATIRCLDENAWLPRAVLCNNGTNASALVCAVTIAFAMDQLEYGQTLSFEPKKAPIVLLKIRSADYKNHPDVHTDVVSLPKKSLDAVACACFARLCRPGTNFTDDSEWIRFKAATKRLRDYVSSYISKWQ